MYYRITILFLLVVQISNAQVTDYTSTFKSSNNKQFRFHYDNDFFTKTDEYYTQGITLEFVHPALKKNSINKILLKIPNSEYKYGIAINHFGYTPTSIRSNDILYGDRPFASNLTISSFITSKNAAKKKLITSFFTIGIIGQGAGGKEMQVTIHKWLNNTIPQGWQHQIQNDLILTYQLNYEEQLNKNAKWFLLNTAAEIKLGTHTNKAKGGFNFMLGKFKNPYETFTQNKKRKVYYYFYGQAQTGVVLYDATLQGGVFNKKSPYTISVSNINRITTQADAGIVLRVKKAYFEYSQSIITKEFKTGTSHRWGGIRVGFDL